MKESNETFVVESVPNPTESQGKFMSEEIATEIKPEMANDNDKYDIENAKSIVKAAQDVKFDCMNSKLSGLIIKCDGNIRLRELTAEEAANEDEHKNLFKDHINERMKEFEDKMKQIREIFENNFGNR